MKDRIVLVRFLTVLMQVTAVDVPSLRTPKAYLCGTRGGVVGGSPLLGARLGGGMGRLAALTTVLGKEAWMAQMLSEVPRATLELRLLNLTPAFASRQLGRRRGEATRPPRLMRQPCRNAEVLSSVRAWAPIRAVWPAWARTTIW